MNPNFLYEKCYDDVKKTKYLRKRRFPRTEFWAVVGSLVCLAVCAVCLWAMIAIFTDNTDAIPPLPSESNAGGAT